MKTTGAEGLSLGIVLRFGFTKFIDVGGVDHRSSLRQEFALTNFKFCLLAKSSLVRVGSVPYSEHTIDLVSEYFETLCRLRRKDLEFLRIR